MCSDVLPIPGLIPPILVHVHAPTQESFEHIQDWLNEVNRYASEGTCKLLVGNKSDRSDKVVSTEKAKVRTRVSMWPCVATSIRPSISSPNKQPTNQPNQTPLQKFADELGIPFLETSAKNASNVEEAFLTMAQELIRIREAKAGATASGSTGAKAGSAGEGTVSVSSKNAEKKAAGAKNCC